MEDSATTGRLRVPVNNLNIGTTELNIVLYDSSKGDYRTITYPLTVRPAAVQNFSSKNVITHPTKAVFNNLGKSGGSGNATDVLIQQKKSGKWVTVKTVAAGTKSATVTGLKQNTSYEFRELQRCNGVMSTPTATAKVKTGVSKKVGIKSVKVWGAKQTYTPKKWVAGHYGPAGIWIKGYYTGGYYTTTFKFKIVLKNKPKYTIGAKVMGKHFKCSGSSITGTMKLSGKQKGKTKTFTVKPYRSSSYRGYAIRSSGKKAKIK